MTHFASGIYQGMVYHKRFKPKVHNLDYRVFSFLLDLDELPVLDQELKLFSHNRNNVLSFWDKDHGSGDGTDLRSYVETILQTANIDIRNGSIHLLCYPRVFGYVFNPLSVYYCYDPHGSLCAIIYEVSNTFGQRHSYVMTDKQGSDNTVTHSCDKEFYVSPFMEMQCRYTFSMSLPQDTIGVHIKQTDAEGTLLTASFQGAHCEITDASLAKLMFKYPLMTLKVMCGIHWEALKLWRKGLKLVPRPAPPTNPITIVSSQRVDQYMETKP